MKATELMIGDWVELCQRGEYYQITEIGEDFVMLGQSHECRESEIDPIPLTAEILEKNGFEPYKDWFLGYGYRLRAEEGTDKILYIYPLRGGNGESLIDIKYAPLNNYTFLSLTTFDRYVHTLQHALRLCGIDKEIEL